MQTRRIKKEKKERKHFVSSRMKKPKEERKKEAEESKKPVEGKSISGALANPFQSISLPFFSFHPTFIFVSLSWQWEAKTTHCWELWKPNSLWCNDSKLSFDIMLLLLFIFVLIHIFMIWSSIFMYCFRIQILRNFCMLRTWKE